MKLFLGVDGGQSSTTAWIGDETGRVLGAGSGGPCNHAGAAEGRGKLVRAVEESVGAACARAGLGAGTVRFAAACFGMSGGPAGKRAILAEIVPADVLHVTTDAAIALSGATAGGPGIVTIAGTGSIACGRNASGTFARAGGWGYIFGDEGSAFDIVRQALRAALRREEGWGVETALKPALLEATGAADANELLHLFYTPEWPRSRVATLAQLVDAKAAAGDLSARAILDSAAAGLAVLADAVHRQLFPPGAAVDVAYIAGVFHSAFLLARYHMKITGAGNRCVRPVHGPAAGALLEAYGCAGLRPVLRDLPEFKP